MPFLLYLALPVALLAQAQEAPGRIVGRVIAAETQAPLDTVRVILVRLPAAQGPPRPYTSALADADGRLQARRN